MDENRRIVTQLPLKELWQSGKIINAEKVRILSKIEIKELLRTTTVKFVLADISKPLKWFVEKESFSVWKIFKNNIVDNPSKIFLEDFPDSYALIASLWMNNHSAIILLEKHH